MKYLLFSALTYISLSQVFDNSLSDNIFFIILAYKSNIRIYLLPNIGIRISTKYWSDSVKKMKHKTLMFMCS